MSNPVAFPSGLRPSSRSYSPGEYPSRSFESLDGTKTYLRYGNKRVNATLNLGFSNISDADAALILSNYESVNSDWDYITFNDENATLGINSSNLKAFVNETGSSLRWRYDGPPSVTSIFPGRSNVSCSFIACLDSP
jgi:hypothetical protein